MKKYINHFKVISKHKMYVMKACFKVGLIKQGLLHDLSKFSPIEFFSSAKYFQGNSSPIDAEKRKKGYSIAWQNHKGKNMHHWQYWIDWENGKQFAIEIPKRYVVEMICDWVGAGKAYNNVDWSVETLSSWYGRTKCEMIFHPNTEKFIDYVINSIAKNEEDLYTYMRLQITLTRISSFY